MTSCKHRQSYTLIPLFMLFCVPLYAQPDACILTGTVRERWSAQPLPGAHIRVLGTTAGASTNIEGEYRISLPQACDTIVFSFVGYRSDTTVAWCNHLPPTLDVALQPITLSLPEVLVLGGDEDPADEVIRRTIKRKHEALAPLQSYRCNAYTKTVIRRRDKEKQDTTIMALFETQTTCLWKKPDAYKEIITARRQTGNFSANDNIFTVGRIPDLSESDLPIGSCSVVNPISEKAFGSYRFRMLDTLLMDSTWVFRIQIEPKSSLEPLLQGTIVIADKSYRVLQVDVRGNEALDLAPIEDLHIRQSFGLLEDRFWLPTESATTFRVKLAIPSMPLFLVEQYSLLHDYAINTAISSSVFDNVMLSTGPTADLPDSAAWSRMTVLPLTSEERNTYARVDSEMQNAGLLAKVLRTLTRLPDDPTLTNISDLYHYNRVEGSSLGLGLTFHRLLPGTLVTLKGSYAFAEKTTDYAVGFEHSFTEHPALSLGVERYRRHSYREGEEFIPRWEVTLLSLFDKNDPVDHFRTDGYACFARVTPLPSVTAEMRYVDEQESSLTAHSSYSIALSDQVFRPNPRILDGRARYGSLTLAYDGREYLSVGSDFDRSRNSAWGSLTVEHSDNAHLRSDVEYTRYLASLSWHLLAFRSGVVEGFLRMGYGTGAVPPQKLFDVLGAMSGLSGPGTLRTVHAKEFAGDRLASLQVEYNFGSLPYRALGISFMDQLDFVVFGGAAWTDLSPRSASIQPVLPVACRQVLSEMGLGIGRILSFLRCDFAFRTTGNDKGAFAFSVGSPLW